jgi:thiol-disulfide isomerase/thioredoxin
VRRAALYAAIAAVGALIGIGCSSRSAPKSETTVASAAADTSGPPVVPITADGIRAIAAANGGATLVNVWATWCAPCREEFPALLSVAQAHKADGLRLMLVSADFDDDVPAVKKFLLAHGVRDTSFLKTGNDQKFINDIHPDWTGALPATLVLDASGNVVAFWEGMADSSRFEAAVGKALAAPKHKERT